MENNTSNIRQISELILNMERDCIMPSNQCGGQYMLGMKYLQIDMLHNGVMDSQH